MPKVSKNRYSDQLDLFETGQMDRFGVTCKALGDLERLKIGHDAKGLGSSWYLAKVEVEHMCHGKKWVFTAERWLDKHKDDRQTWVELKAQMYAASSASPTASPMTASLASLTAASSASPTGMPIARV